jgi:hypothetical protein
VKVYVAADAVNEARSSAHNARRLFRLFIVVPFVSKVPFAA